MCQEISSCIDLEKISENLTPDFEQKIETNQNITQDNRENLYLESPESQVPLNSLFYIERSAKEANCYDTILESGALIRIKAPRKMGKTSLKSRILDYACKQDYNSL